MANDEFIGKRCWTDWLRLAIEVLFALIIFAVRVWLAIAASVFALALAFSINAIGTVLVAGRLTYLEAFGARYGLSHGALNVKARWFVEDLLIPYEQIDEVKALDPEQTWPQARFLQELDNPTSDGKPYIYIGWPSREGLVQISLIEEMAAKYKLPQDFDPRDIVQAIPWKWRRVHPTSFKRIILSVSDRDAFINQLRTRAGLLDKKAATAREVASS